MSTTRERQRIHFVEWNARINTLGSMDAVFPKHGTLVLASRLRDLGHDVQVFLEGVSDMDADRLAHCDAVCLPVYAPTLTKVQACAEQLRRLRPDLPLIVGGPQVCFFPDTVLDFCDYAVRCEGDDVLPQLLDALAGHGRPEDVPGVSYRRDGQAVHNPEPPPPTRFDSVPDPELIQGFWRAAKPLFGQAQVTNTIQTSRGCKFRCKFCPTLKLFQGAYRNRDIDSVVEDFRRRKRFNDFFFAVDNDFCCDRSHTRALLHRLIDEDLDLHLTIFERHEISRDPEMLKLLRRAGVDVIIVGVESLLNQNLSAYNKEQSTEQVLRSIQTIRDHGMHVLTTFVLGGDQDTPAAARQLVEFIRETGLTLNLFILHDIETDPQREQIIPLERRFMTHWQATDAAETFWWDYFTGSFATYFPKRMKPSTLQRAVLDIGDEVYAHNKILRSVFDDNALHSLFKIFVGYGMKRMNDNLRRIVDAGYLDYLRQIEDGLYDDSERLREDRLAALDGLPLPPPVPDWPEPTTYDTVRLLASLPGLARLGLQGLRSSLRPRARAPGVA